MEGNVRIASGVRDGCADMASGGGADLAAADSGPRALFCPIRGGERCMGAACAWAARQGGRWVCGPAASAAALARTVSRWGEARACGR